MKTITPILHAPRRAFLARASALSFAPLASGMAGCAGGAAQPLVASGGNSYQLDTTIRSPNQDARVNTLVLHFTAQTLATSLQMLTDPQRGVSAHYLVPDSARADGQFHVHQLVAESMRAWHAGVSSWRGQRMLNANTIGIEIVNAGHPSEDEELPWMSRRWQPFADAQIAVVGELAADIVRRYGIAPDQVVGHADIAPDRKDDPGPLFPWQRLHQQYRVGAWPEAEAVSFYSANQPYRGDVARLQARLLDYGYDTPQTGTLDAATTAVIATFQMHFRPARYDGMPDVETAAILDALLEKYRAHGRVTAETPGG